MSAARLARTMGWAAMLAASVACTQPLRLTPDDSPVVLARTTIAAPNPGEKGTFAVRTMYYGSGIDRQRAVFRDSVTIRTPLVDISRLATVASAATVGVTGPPPPPSVGAGLEKRHREFWGFDLKHVPLNARVWYPEGAGPFPLVLIVHGNHDPQQFSDPGYAWLGEHLASRGFIVASIDENFVNGLAQENDARGWLLLKHLEQWRAWNDSAANVFRGRVDLGRIGLIGHSRGGEAIVHAAMFNRMGRYPDDARIRLGFGFGIKSLIAIAPVDGQYRPAGRLAQLENVNYLVVYGSHDGDVVTFAGNRQYMRLRFSDGRPWVKSSIYVYRANHGQWNTVWGSSDRGPIFSPRTLDVRGLLSGEEQRQFARVALGGFLEATLHDRREYLAMFRDHRSAGGWLPPTMYVTRFEDASFRPVATFEEDVDPATGTATGVRLEGDSLSTWREGMLRFRVPTSVNPEGLNDNAVWLGWNNRLAGADTSRRARVARYTIQLPDSVGRTHSDAMLVMSLAPTRDVPPPRARAGGAQATASGSTPPTSGSPPSTRTVADTTSPMDLTIELEDVNGRVARQPLSRYGPVRRPLEARVHRRADRDAQSFTNPFELVLQTYVLPLTDFAGSAEGADVTRLRAIRLTFDRTPGGTIVLDEVGFMRPDATDASRAAR